MDNSILCANVSLYDHKHTRFHPNSMSSSGASDVYVNFLSISQLNFAIITAARNLNPSTKLYEV